jgi:hypothetical protein
VQSEVVYLPQHTHAMVNRQVGVAGDPTTEAIIRFLTGLGAPLSAGERQP